MDRFKVMTATKEFAGYATRPRPKYKPLNRTARARLKRELERDRLEFGDRIVIRRETYERVLVELERE